MITLAALRKVTNVSAVKNRRAHELLHLAREIDLDGIYVKARCYNLTCDDEEPRVEIHLESQGRRGIYDCPEVRENRVIREIDATIRCFAAATRLRSKSSQ